MSSAENVAAFQSIACLTGQMREAAEAGEWDRLAELERSCAALVAQLRAAQPMHFSAELQRQKVELIHKILADDAAIRNYTEPWMKRVQSLLGNAALSRRVRQAYDPDALR
jgi:flagellar protein FliT